MKITRELLEHYLRATGQEREGLSYVALCVTAGLTDVLAFRLGLCAAAEHDLMEARRLVDTPAALILSSPTARRNEQAGIDPAAWEKARQA